LSCALERLSVQTVALRVCLSQNNKP